MLVSVIGEVIVPGTPSNVTLVAPVNPTPVTSTDVPPLLGPVDGLTPVTLMPYVNSSADDGGDSAEVRGDVRSEAGNAGLVTVTSTVPVELAGDVTLRAVDPLKHVGIAEQEIGAAVPN
jgi:hypothetical protein